MNCTSLTWSPTTADALGPTIVVCAVSIIVHVLFWIEIAVFSSLRQKNLLWLYDYLISDFLLLIRFFVLYGIRREGVCLYPTLRLVLCYFEASSKFYMNGVQTYLLLGLTASRYAQIVYNRNVYVENARLVLFSHLLIITLPALNVIVQFLTGWTLLWRHLGAACDILYVSLSAQIFNLFALYIIPVTVNLLLIALCIRHVSSTRGMRSQQIIDRRRKHSRMLLGQTITFYSIWLALWSPNMLAFQFTNINSDAGIYTSLLNYVEIALDPAIVAVLDVRFFKTWQSIWQKIRRARQGAVAPLVPLIAEHKY